MTGIVLRCAQSISRFAFWQLSEATGGDGGYPSRIYSDGIEQIFGVPAAEMTAGADDYVARFVHPDDRAPALEAFRRFLRRDDPHYSIEYRIRHASGEWRTVREAGEWKLSAEGLPVAAAGVLQDVTDRSAIETQLRQSEALLASAQRLASIGTWRGTADPADPHGGIGNYHYSQAAAALHGVTPAELDTPLENYVARFVHPDDQQRYLTELRPFIGGKRRTFAIQFRVRQAPGAWRTLYEIAEWEFDAGGRPIGATAVMQDITDHADAATELKQRSTLLLRAQEIAKLGYWQFKIDPAGRTWPATIKFSESAALLHGVPASELSIPAANYVARFVHPDDQMRTLAVFDDFWSGKLRDYAVSFRLRRPDGTWLHVHERAEWDFDVAGRPAGAIGVIQDVTGRVESEIALHQSESLLARAQDIAKLGYWRWRPAPDSKDWYDSDIYYSDTMAKIFGIAVAELFVPDRQFASRFVHPDDRARIQDVYDRFFIDGEPRYEEEYRIRHSSGEWRWIHEIAEWDIGPDGNRIGATGVLQDITTRIETEQALRHSEALLTRAQRTARMGHWEWRPGSSGTAGWNGAAHYSPTAAELFGVAPDELELPSEEFVRRYLHPEDVSRGLHIYNRFVEGQLTRYEIDYRIRHADGRWRWIHEIAQWDYDENGAPIGAAGVLQDMTERVNAETALKNSEASLKRAQQIAKLAHWHWFADPPRTRWTDGAATYSAEAAEIFGVPVEELRVPMPVYVQRYVHPDDREAVLNTFDDFLEARATTFAIEYRIQHSSGEWRNISERGEWDRAPDGRLLGATGTLQDVTELREAERALKESAAQLKLITDNLPVSIGYMDRDERIRFVNATAERWYGIPAQELVGMTLREAMGEETYSHMLPHIQAALSGSTAKLQTRRQYRVGPPRDIEMLYIPHVTADRKVLGFFGMVFDLTERLAMEAQLRQAQKMEAVGQLTGGIAHDFNNLLGVIVGNLDLLATQMTAEAKGRELVMTALDAAESGASLIRRLLAFSRRQMLMPTLTDLKDLIGGMMVLLRRSLSESIDIETRIPAGLWPILVDAGQLESAILNLAINARDAMPKGGCLTIALANETVDDDALPDDDDALPGDYVRLVVHDTGSGIPPDILSRVFEPFFTTKPVGQGTGLGLSMVYGFVKQSGGFLHLDSKVGEGTEISLYLPRAATYPTEATDDAKPHRTLRGNGEVVLVVEDRTEMRAYSAEALRTLNYEPVEVADGKKALEVLAARKDVAVLFSDVVLPGGMSGFDLARIARAQRPSLPVLLTSGYSERVSGPRPDDVEPLLEKPFRVAELGRRLATLLGRALA
ncbi:MAG: PAS domain-containing protein [Pseudomonadota bacterium]